VKLIAVPIFFQEYRILAITVEREIWPLGKLPLKLKYCFRNDLFICTVAKLRTRNHFHQAVTL
jgi:hypothetical protein